MRLDTLAQKIEDLEELILGNNEGAVVNRLENIGIFADANSGYSGLEGAFSEHLTLNAKDIEALFIEEQYDLAGLDSSELRGFVDGVRYEHEPSIKNQILTTIAANAEEGQEYLDEGDTYQTISAFRYFKGFAAGVQLVLNHTTEGYEFKLIDEDNPEGIYEGFEYFPNLNSVKVDGHEEPLTDPENELLQYLVIHKDTELSREKIMEGAWEGLDKDLDGDIRFFYNTMKGLRGKIQPTQLRPQLIHSRGKGRYRFSVRLDRIYRPQVEYDPKTNRYDIKSAPIELKNNKPRKILDVIRENGSDGATDREIVDKVWSPQHDIQILNAPMSTLKRMLSNANPMQPCPLYNDEGYNRVRGFN